jgi:hypothetical protein
MKVSPPVIPIELSDGTKLNLSLPDASELFAQLGAVLALRPGPGLDAIQSPPAIPPLIGVPDPPTLSSAQENQA